MAEENINIPQGEMIEVPLFYTNDLHGEIEKFGQIATIVRQKQKEGEEFLLFDSGDFSSGTSISDTHKGKPMVELINITPYTAVGLGEGEFAFGTEGLNNILQEIRCPVICSNLYLKDGSHYKGVMEYLIKEFKGVKFGIIGLLSPDTVKWAIEKSGKNLPGLENIEIKSPEDRLMEILPQIKKEGAEKFIILSHLGIDKDAALAEKFDELDVIISGHSHSYLAQPVKVKDTLIVSSGSGGKYLGSLTLNISDILSMKISKNK